MLIDSTVGSWVFGCLGLIKEFVDGVIRFFDKFIGLFNVWNLVVEEL
jgi:hypothetical protein